MPSRKQDVSHRCDRLDIMSAYRSSSSWALLDHPRRRNGRSRRQLQGTEISGWVSDTFPDRASVERVVENRIQPGRDGVDAVSRQTGIAAADEKGACGEALALWLLRFEQPRCALGNKCGESTILSNDECPIEHEIGPSRRPKIAPASCGASAPVPLTPTGSPRRARNSRDRRDIFPGRDARQKSAIGLRCEETHMARQRS